MKNTSQQDKKTTKRYQFTDEDRRKGGLATAKKSAPAGFDSHMQYLGSLGLKAFADKYTDGDVEVGGILLSKCGNFTTDPTPWNGAFSLPSYTPYPLRKQMTDIRNQRWGIK